MNQGSRPEESPGPVNPEKLDVGEKGEISQPEISQDMPAQQEFVIEEPPQGMQPEEPSKREAKREVPGKAIDIGTSDVEDTDINTMEQASRLVEEINS